MDRRALLLSGLAFGLPIWSTRAAPPAELRIGLQKIGPLVVLRKQRTLEDALGPVGTKVTWVEFNSGPPIMEALNANGIDFAYTGDAPPIFAQAAGVAFVYVGYQPNNGRNEGLLVRKDSPAQAIPDLKGKRVGVTRGSSAHNFLLQALTKNGLTLGDVQVSYLQPPDAAAAFRQGSIDAWAIWDPFFAVAEQDPQTRVLATGLGLSPTNNFFLARRAYANANPALMVNLVKYMNDTAEWTRSHQDELSELMAQLTGVDIAAERVATRRGSFTAALLDDGVIGQQQAIADTFAKQRVIPAAIDIRAAVWTAPKSGSPA
jgi:aliphatic sulfonates family ABC transporter substrate-binding protein